VALLLRHRRPEEGKREGVGNKREEKEESAEEEDRSWLEWWAHGHAAACSLAFGSQTLLRASVLASRPRRRGTTNYRSK